MALLQLLDLFGFSRFLRPRKTSPIRRPRPRVKPDFERFEERMMPAPVATIQNLPGTVRPLLGESVTYSFNFTNTGNEAGFGPFASIFLDTSGPDGNTSLPLDGYGTPTLSVAGLTLTPSNVITLTAADVANGTYFNPFANITQPIPGDTDGNGPDLGDFGVNDTIYIYGYPFGSFTPGQTTLATLTLPTSNLADVGTPLPLAIAPGFLANNPALTGPRILGATVGANTIPELWRLTKTYIGPESETATGPSYPRQYRLDLDIATGQSIANTTIGDVLADSMQYISLASSSVHGAATVPTTLLQPSNSTPGDNLLANFGTVVGADGTDVSLTFNFYVPRDRTAGANSPVISPTLPPAGPGSSLDTNRSNAAGLWTPIDVRDRGPGNAPLPVSITLGTAGTTHTLEEHSIATQKSVTAYNLGNGVPIGGSAADPYRPGQTLLQYTIEFQVSDYYAFQGITLQDILGDGQRLYLGNLPAGLGGGSAAPRIEFNNAFDTTTGNRVSSPLGFFTGNGTIVYEQQWTEGNVTWDPTSYGNSSAPGSFQDPDGAGGIFIAGNLPEPTGNVPTPPGTTALQFNISQELMNRLPNTLGRMVGGDIPGNGTGAPQKTTPTSAATWPAAARPPAASSSTPRSASPSPTTSPRATAPWTRAIA